MTTHNRDKIIAAAKEAGFDVWIESVGPIPFWIERFYAIAFAAGAASRDAEIDDLGESLAQVKLKNAMLIKERDQLREQVKMLRDALEVTHELYANASSGYGFARPENPHNFHCDIDCCSKEEIAAHSKACDDYAAGRKVSNDSWGIGTYCDEYAPAIKALAATEPKP